MSIPWPRCGNEEPHQAHPADSADFSAPDCPGWTAGQMIVRHLVTSVNEYVQEHYNPYGLLPAGLRLEVSPQVRYLLMRDQDLWERPGREGALEDFFPVPVRVTTDLGKGRWRLVIVTEEVLLGGATEPS